MTYRYPFYSPRVIHETLSERGAAILKRRGQNFLTDPNQTRLIADTVLENCPGPLIEIGPGLGALTHRLLLAGRQVRGLEIDPVLSDILAEELGAHFENFTLVRGDALKFLQDPEFVPGEGPEERHSICGNLPYYITTDLLMACLSRGGFRQGVFLVQTEFARRAASDDAESSLTVYLANFGEWRIALKVPRGAFNPAPAVESAVLVFSAYPEGPRTDPVSLEKILRMSFGGKRKKIQNAWKKSHPKHFDPELLKQTAESLAIDVDRRAEELSFESYYKLASEIIKTQGR